MISHDGQLIKNSSSQSSDHRLKRDKGGTSVLDRMEQKIKTLSAEYPEILAVYLFGSQARGDAHLQSDLDLAILFQKGPSLDEHAGLVSKICRLLRIDRVDVVILNEAPPALKFDVVSEGKLLFSALSDESLNDFELRIIKEYFDTEPLRRVQDLYLKERMLGGF